MSMGYDLCEEHYRPIVKGLEARIVLLEKVRAAAKRVADDYASLADSGDCGNWTCEDAVDGYVELRSALADCE